MNPEEYQEMVLQRLDDIIELLKVMSGKHDELTEPATQRQRNYLKILGISFDENITKLEASNLIDATKGGGTE